MMKKNKQYSFGLILFLAICSHVSFAQIPQYLWAKQASGVSQNLVNSLVTDPGGNIYVTGFYNGPTRFSQNDSLLGNGNVNVDSYIAKYNPNGQLIWVKKSGCTVDDFGKSITIGQNGDIYVLGTIIAYNQTALFSFDSFSFTPSHSKVCYLIKMDGNGNISWLNSVEYTNYNEAVRVKTDNNNNVVVLMDNYPVANIRSYSPTGAQTWSSTINGRVGDMAIDPSGKIVVTGISPGLLYNNTVLYSNPNILYNNGWFVLKLNPTGAVSSFSQFATSSGNFNDGPAKIAINQNNEIFVLASTRSPSLISGSQTITSQGHEDLFLVKIDQVGLLSWINPISSPGIDIAGDVVCDPYGNVFVAGSLNGLFVEYHSPPPCLPFGENRTAEKCTMFLRKYDSTGNMIFQKNQGNAAECGTYCNVLKYNTDGSLLAGGFVFEKNVFFDNNQVSATNDGCDLFIAKLGGTLLGLNAFSTLDGKAFVYPTQSSGIFKCDLPPGSQLFLYSLTGQLVLKCESQTYLDFHGVEDGLYLLKDDAHHNVSRIIIQH